MQVPMLLKVSVVVILYAGPPVALGEPLFMGFGDLPGGSIRSVPYASGCTSADGSVIVGYSDSDAGTGAFRWEAGVMSGLGDLPAGEFDSGAYGVSADGSIVTGVGLSALF